MLDFYHKTSATPHNSKFSELISTFTSVTLTWFPGSLILIMEECTWNPTAGSAQGVPSLSENRRVEFRESEGIGIILRSAAQVLSTETNETFLDWFASPSMI